ncbi:MAG: efflux RND transporter periplasmic adaptor subunit [Acidobacteriota bacterium]
MRYILLPLLLVVACLAGCSGDKPPAHGARAARTVDVPVRTVARADVVECRSFPAQVESEQSVTLASKLSGTVEAVMAREGDRLAAGAPIMRLDDKDLVSQEQGLAAEREQVVREKQALAARAGLAKTTMDRLGRLLAQRAVSQEDFDKAKAEYDAVSRQIDASTAKEQAVTAKIAELAALRAYTRITAPFDGILARRYVDQGAFVTAGAPLALIDAASGGFEVTAQVDETLLGDVRQGQTIIAAVPALAAGPFAVTVSAIVGRVDPQYRTFKLKCSLPTPVPEASGPPRAGMFGRLFVPARTAKKLLVPADCLALRGDLPTAFAADDAGMLHLRVVKTGGTFLAVTFDGATYLTDSEAFDPAGRERFVEVISGLSDGEKLACDAGATLRDGDRLVTAPAGAPK